MEFKKLREMNIKEIEDRFNKSVAEMQTEEGLKNKLRFYGKSYVNNPKEKLIKLLSNRKEKEIVSILNEIQKVENAEDFEEELIITLEWKKSYMWGMNPRAYTNRGFSGDSIGGCGYCKTSTATAQALNSDLRILKLLYGKEEERLNKLKISKMSEKDKDKFLERRGFLGYGSGYGILPGFEGGVGVSSHEVIIEGLGLNMRCITNTGQTNVYLINKQ